MGLNRKFYAETFLPWPGHLHHQFRVSFTVSRGRIKSLLWAQDAPSPPPQLQTKIRCEDYKIAFLYLSYWLSRYKYSFEDNILPFFDARGYFIIICFSSGVNCRQYSQCRVYKLVFENFSKFHSPTRLLILQLYIYIALTCVELASNNQIMGFGTYSKSYSTVPVMVYTSRYPPPVHPTPSPSRIHA